MSEFSRVRPAVFAIGRRGRLNASWAAAAIVAGGATAAGPPSDCCVEHPGRGCDNPACEAAVCAIDTFCCNIAWDEICAAEAIQFPECGCASPGCGKVDHSCFDIGAPGCENAACCTDVCAVDPSCCESLWDIECVDIAIDLCPSLAQPNLSVSNLHLCVLPDGFLQIGWNNGYLPEWTFPKQIGPIDVLVTIQGDSTTASHEFSIWYLPEPGFNSECEGENPTNCGAGQCELWITTIDDGEATQFLPLRPVCLPSPGGCMCGLDSFPMVIKTAFPPGEKSVVVTVAADAMNHDDELDETDNVEVGLVTQDGACATGACCLPDGFCVDGMHEYECAVVQQGIYHGDGMACADVTVPCLAKGACMLDHDVQASCVLQDEAGCIELGGAYLGDGTLCASNCCFAHSSTDCDDPACLDLVCAIDSFCCSVLWDQLCADEAVEVCAICTPNPPGAPANNECADAIQAFDGQTAFSTVNANASDLTHPNCLIGGDVWFTYHATTIGPVTVSLCDSSFDTVLAIYDNDQCDISDQTLLTCNDDFCGSRSQTSFVADRCGQVFTIRVGGWDSATGACIMTISSSGDCPPGPCPADFDGSGMVGPEDLATLLAVWGDSGSNGPADFDQSGLVDAADLAQLLASWGQCTKLRPAGTARGPHPRPSGLGALP